MQIRNFTFLPERLVDRARFSKRYFQNQNKNKNFGNLTKISSKIEEMNYNSLRPRLKAVLVLSEVSANSWPSCQLMEEIKKRQKFTSKLPVADCFEEINCKQYEAGLRPVLVPKPRVKAAAISKLS